jgi:hypothetical protein
MNTQSQENEFQVNESYRDHYRRTMKLLTLLIVICAVLSVILTWMTYDQKQPKYYAAVTTGEVVPMYALSEPVVTSDFIIQWSALAARRVYNLSFDTYAQQLNQVKDKFTPQGWNKMLSAMQGMIAQLTGSRLQITSVVTGSPVVLGRLIIHGRFTWRVQMRLLVTYTSPNAVRQNTLIVTMNVQRVPTLNASQGIQIVDFSSVAAM